MRAVSRSALTQGAVEPLSTSYELLKGGGMQVKCNDDTANLIDLVVHDSNELYCVSVV